MKTLFSRALTGSRILISAILASTLLLSACGQSGNLVHPKKTFDSPS